MDRTEIAWSILAFLWFAVSQWIAGRKQRRQEEERDKWERQRPEQQPEQTVDYRTYESADAFEERLYPYAAADAGFDDDFDEQEVPAPPKPSPPATPGPTRRVSSQAVMLRDAIVLQTLLKKRRYK